MFLSLCPNIRYNRYGVTRVYSQQCTYVLNDAVAAQTAMRAMLKSRGGQLDSSAGKAKPEQLMLADDPAFLPDMALPPLEFEVSRMSLEPESGGRSQSMMSVGGRRYDDPFHSNHKHVLFVGLVPGIKHSKTILTSIVVPFLQVLFHLSTLDHQVETPSRTNYHSMTLSVAPVRNPTLATMAAYLEKR